MRGRDGRAVERVATYLAETGVTPDPSVLAELIGTSAAAAGCELFVGSARYQWGRPADSWWRGPVVYDGVRQGEVAVSPSSAGPLPTLAAVLGAPLAMVRLAYDTDSWRRAGDAATRELIDDRWRTATELEQERRALERDLHDGAQHQLVALRMALALVAHTGEQEWRAAVLSRLDTAERVLTDTAAGILPIELAENGLAAGLTAELARHDDVSLHIGGLYRRYSPVIESTVYFACLEAVNNAHKHAPGAAITVTVRDTAHGVEFVVADTGPGFADEAPISGLHNLSARAAAVGGVVRVRSVPGRGTTVTGFLPH